MDINIKNNNMDELINKTDESEKKEEIKQDKKDIQEKKEKKLFSFKEFHKKYHKHLLILPVIFLIFSLGYMFYFYNSTGDYFYKDISLTGGTTVTVIGEMTSSSEIQSSLSEKLDDLNVREIYDLVSNERKAIILETKSDSETTRNVLEEYLGYRLNDENSSFEFSGSTLSQSFFKQLMTAILLAFIFMAIVVFIMFRNLVPSSVVILSAFADILMTLVTVNILGIQMSSGGIVAFLMLIGYSVDTDILLTTRLLKRHEGDLYKRVAEAFKTGITMTLTSLVAVSIALIIVNPFSIVLSQIFTIIVIGLFFDIFNTWITNLSLVEWYIEHLENKETGRGSSK